MALDTNTLTTVHYTPGPIQELQNTTLPCTRNMMHNLRYEDTFVSDCRVS